MKWVRKGVVRVGGKKREISYRLALGDVVTMPPVAPSAPAPAPTAEVELSVVYEDDDLLVVDKPAGLLSQPGSGHDDSLALRVVRYLGREGAAPGLRPGLVQRLDRDVSGLVPAGKNALALRALTRTVEDGTLIKEYEALVEGRVANEHGTVELPLLVKEHAPADKPRVLAHPSGEPSYTEYRILKRYSETTLLAVRIKTGRMHQIRAHMLAMGHPIVGDPRYNPGRDVFHLQRPFLHAARLWVPHPREGRVIMCEGRLAPELERVLERLR